ncbi:hypothetical protein [Clostridium sp. C2-6-12]|uniref:putative ABC transporter permease n=1 Tax=Clostridium sp. C2-6-12 TaxID=2698832 RepID=UPI00136853EA|nr:hypothetical protein [Clostridium sp. C2-6-12]
MNIVSMYFFYFSVYSFLGWICETTYCAIIDKKFVNRGFLKGPVCPIYGVGAVIVISVLNPVADNIILLFLCGMILTSILEYFTGFLLEVIFNLKWWDYSEHKFNLKGRVCLLNSVLFGILSVITVNFINPVITKIIESIPNSIDIFVLGILAISFFMDTIITGYKMLQLSGKLKEINVLYQEIKEKSEVYKDIVQQNIEKLDELMENEKIAHTKELIRNLKTKLESTIMKNKSVNKRIFKAFPNMKSLKYNAPLDRLKDELKKIKKK